jgi:hypothetical protein
LGAPLAAVLLWRATAGKFKDEIVPIEAFAAIVIAVTRELGLSPF